jgi:hypothetical protein
MDAADGDGLDGLSADKLGVFSRCRGFCQPNPYIFHSSFRRGACGQIKPAPHTNSDPDFVDAAGAVPGGTGDDGPHCRLANNSAERISGDCKRI